MSLPKLSRLAVLLSLIAAVATAGEVPPGMVAANLEAGPIWSNEHAQTRCPEVVEEWKVANPGREASWTGQWTTTIPGEMSVCDCLLEAEAEVETVTYIFRNTFPSEIRDVTVTRRGKDPETVFSRILPRQSVKLALANPEEVESLAFDVRVGSLVFDDLGDLPRDADTTFDMTMGDDEEVVLSGTANGEAIRITGKVDMTLVESDDSLRLRFAEVLEAGTIAKVREKYLGEMKKTPDGYLVWVDFGDEPWAAYLVPEAEDGEEGAFATVLMMTPKHYASTRDALNGIHEAGFRPWRIWERGNLGEFDGLPPLESLAADGAELEEEDPEEPMEKLAKRLGSDRGEDAAWVTRVLFVNQATLEEAKAGEPLSPQPIFVYRQDNSILNEVVYLVDGSSLLR